MITLAPPRHLNLMTAIANRIVLCDVTLNASMEFTDSDLAAELHKKRQKTAAQFQEAISRVLSYAKHETLRNLERHFITLSSRSAKTERDLPSHQTAPAANALTSNAAPDDSKASQQSTRITFNLEEFKTDLLPVLEAEQLSALNAGQETASQLLPLGVPPLGGPDNPWTMPAQATLDFINHRQNLLRDVPEEIWQTIRDTIAEGVQAGDPLKKLAKRVTDAFDQIDAGRAKLIADTETAAAYAYSSDKAARAAGVKNKKWLHSPLAAVPRPDHVAMHGTIVPIDDPFPVGNPPLMYPHDPNGAPEDVINCHCIAIPTQ